MTAVAPPPNFQPVARTGWSGANGAPNGLNMNADDVSRMFMPRKQVQRTNSSSSVSSAASSTSTITAPPVQTNGVVPNPTNAVSEAGWGTRKKPAAGRGLWPPSKAEPIAGITTARPQSIAATSGPSAASAMSALHTPSSMLASQNGVQSQHQTNGAPRTPTPGESTAILYLIPMNGTFERKTISVPFYPDVLRIGRQTNNKTVPSPANGYFDSKVLSRQHAEVWADRNGKVWIRDVKSSNGTFVNGQRLSQENKDSDPHELREQDMLELGIDIVSEDQKSIIHHKVAARVEHAGIYNTGGNNVLDINFGDLDPSANGGMMGLSQGLLQTRGRAGSGGSVGSNGRVLTAPASVAGSNATGVSQQRHMNFWLQPITMEQVVKKLNSEIKLAKLQKQDLQRTTQFMETMMTAESPRENSKTSPIDKKSSPLKGDIKARFSDPPAPPPQQPLPEKPDVAKAVEAILHPSLRRTDTERPKSNGSPVRLDGSPNQINLLAEALTNAKKEIESQSAKLKDMEDRLAQERLARESAEERARRLEGVSLAERSEKALQSDSAHGVLTNGFMEPSREHILDTNEAAVNANRAIGDDTAARLQKRLELMVVEMDEMKQQIEKYRRRAETAEAEADSDRRTLAEMVEKIRNDEAERTNKSEAKQRRRSAGSGEIKFAEKDGVDEKNMDDIAHQANGFVEAMKSLGKQHRETQAKEAPGKESDMQLAKTSDRGEQMANAAPYASIISVVILGMGLMAYLNGWQKVDR